MIADSPIEIIPVANTLGECVLWDSERAALWWTDIQSSRLYRYDWAGRTMQVLQTPERVGSFGFVAASPRLIAAFASGIALYDPADGWMEWISRPEAFVPGIRFNDGRVDRRGRFWSGTMVEDEMSTATGNVYCVEGRTKTHCRVRGVRITNGLCTSPDGAHLYLADSATRLIHVYDLNEPEGTLGPARHFTQTPDGTSPDGATVDADGCLWSAQWGGGRVVRYTPAGRIDRVIEVPASQPSCVCFGGPDLDLLFVTSAREGLDAAELREEPHAGAVFVYRPGSRGLPEVEFQP